MPTIVQQIRSEVENEFENKVKEREIEIAKRMMQKGMDVDTIVEITGISREKLKKLASADH